MEEAKNVVKPRRLVAFEVALDCLTRAEECISCMQGSENRAEYEKVWNEFVGLLERAWTAFYHDGKSVSSRFQPWAGQFEKIRQDDELLLYLTQSRHIAQHAIINLNWQKGKMHLTSTKEGVALYRNFKIFSDGRHEIEFESPVPGNKPRVIVDHGSALLPTIYNARRKKYFRAPASHLNHPLESGDPVEAAKLALEYYESVLAAGITKFGK